MPIPKDTKTQGGTPVVPGKGHIDWSAHGANQNRGNGDDDRPQWRPVAVGDQLTGTIVRADRPNTRFGERSVFEFDGCRGVIADGEEQEGASWMTWPTSGMIDALAEVEARLGLTYTILLAELIDTSKGNPFRRFEVEPAEASF